MVDRVTYSLACVGSNWAPICSLDNLRVQGNISVERDLPNGSKLLLLSKSANPLSSSKASMTISSSSAHGRNRKSSSLEKKKLLSLSSSSSSDDGFQIKRGNNNNNNIGISFSTKEQQQLEEEEEILQEESTKERARPTRHGHRRSLSTSEHLHFAGKGGPPTLTPDAFVPDDDSSEEEDDGEMNIQRRQSRETDEIASVVEHSIHDEDEEEEDDLNSTSSSHVKLQLPIQRSSKGPVARIVTTETKSNSSSVQIGSPSRVLINSPRRNSPARPRRSSAPDLDSIIEHAVSEYDDDHNGATPKTQSDTASPPKSATSASSSTRKMRRHNRQFSAPVVVGGGVDAEGIEAPIMAASELKLGEGLVITRSGLSTNLTPSDLLTKRSNSSYSMFSDAKKKSVGKQQDDGENSMVSPQSLTSYATTPRFGPGFFNPEELETLGVIGRGTAGLVTKALHVTALCLVAVKSVQKFDATKRESTIAEIRALHKKMIPFTDFENDDIDDEDSSCIVGFYDAYLPPEGGSVNLILEWMDGGSLQDLIDKKKSQGKTLSEDFISIACQRMLRGLCELFDERLLHRDMKPANVLVSRSGAVKLSDFGVSIAFGLGDLSNAQTFVGSLSYMAPERVHSSSDHGGYSYASDLWGVGLIAYVCATGSYPFEKNFDEEGFWGMVQAVDEDIPALDPTKFSPELCDLVSQCLRRNPDERPTAQELLKNHPFVNKFKDRPDLAKKAVADQFAPIDQVTARNELNRLLGIAAEFHITNAVKHHHTLPRFSVPKVRRLASQLHVTFSSDEELENLVQSFNSKLTTLGGTSLAMASSSQPGALQSPSSAQSSDNSSSPRSITNNNNSSLWKKNNLKLELTM